MALFDSLMQNGQKYGVSLLKKLMKMMLLYILNCPTPPLPCECKDLLILGQPITGPSPPPPPLQTSGISDKISANEKKTCRDKRLRHSQNDK
jgi:hypothetical protein